MATPTDVGASRRARFATDRAPAREARSQHLGDLSALGDGAVLERLVRMRRACHALAIELAQTRRQLRIAEAELHKLRRQEAD